MESRCNYYFGQVKTLNGVVKHFETEKKLQFNNNKAFPAVSNLAQMKPK